MKILKTKMALLLCVLLLVGLVLTTGCTPPPFKVGFVYMGKVSDGGWAALNDGARVFAIDKLKLTNDYTVVKENIAADKASEALESLAKDGCNLIFATSPEYKTAAKAVAVKYPKVTFLCYAGILPGKDETTDNFAMYGARMYEGRFTAGIIAAKVTTEMKVGYVAAKPDITTNLNINAVFMGIQQADKSKSTTLKVYWTGDANDATKAKTAVDSLVADGCDVIINGLDTVETVKATDAKGKISIGYIYPKSEKDKLQKYATSSIISFNQYFLDMITSLKNNELKAKTTWRGYIGNMVMLDVYGPAVESLSLKSDDPNEGTRNPAKEEVGRVASGLTNGSLKIFKAYGQPIFAQDGTEKIGIGLAKALNENDIKKMDWIIQDIDVGNMPK